MIEQTPLGLRRPSPMRGRADVVFVLDASGSMMNVIDDLKSRLADFVEGVQSDPQISIDWRVATLGQDCSRFYLNSFTTHSGEFAAGLARIEAGSDEYTLPAIDWAADMPWRDGAHRFIVVLSDEPLEGGSRVAWQIGRLPDLMQKLASLRAKLIIHAPQSDGFRTMAQYPGVTYHTISSDRDLLDARLGKVLESIGKTVSVTVGRLSQQDEPDPVEADLYNLKGIIDEV